MRRGDINILSAYLFTCYKIDNIDNGENQTVNGIYKINYILGEWIRITWYSMQMTLAISACQNIP